MSTTTESRSMDEVAPVIDLGADLSPAVQAIEVAYRAIQRKFAGTPDVTIIVSHSKTAWGHTTLAKGWTSSQAAADAEGSNFEIMISSENLRRGAAYVVATLLHESAHAFNLAAGVLDTDMNGRHSRKFADEAERRGLTIKMAGWHGWTDTSLTDEAEAFTARLIKTVARGLAKAAVPAVKPGLGHLAGLIGNGGDEGAAPIKGTGRRGVTVPGTAVAPPKRGDRNLLRAVCGCGKSIRLSRGVLDACQPTCQVCSEPFAA